jgi:hypothetical protein
MFVEGISMPQVAPQIIRMPVTGALSRVFYHIASNGKFGLCSAWRHGCDGAL